MRSSDSNIPSGSNYNKIGSTSLNTAWGVSTTGVLIMNGISAEGVDPFYPAQYGTVTDPDSVVEKVDWCLAHPQNQGIFHYHIASPCQGNNNFLSEDSSRTGQMTADVIALSQKGYSNLQYRSVYGISKDGRPIYTPYHTGGEMYTACQVDVCNGLEVNGYYSYVATYFHPYFIGCFGTGSNPDMPQQCSTKPKSCSGSSNSLDGSGASTLMLASLVAAVNLVY